MEAKFFEIRDEGTCISAVGLRISRADGFVARRVGYGSPLVFLTTIDRHGRGTYDSCNWQWNGRTMQIAHDWIQKNWESLNNGQVVDVRFILGERDEPVISDEFYRY